MKKKEYTACQDNAALRNRCRHQLFNYFLLTPYITDTIGIEAYGFVSMAKTAVSYAQIFTIALTTFVVRYIFCNIP